MTFGLSDILKFDGQRAHTERFVAYVNIRAAVNCALKNIRKTVRKRLNQREEKNAKWYAAFIFGKNLTKSFRIDYHIVFKVGRIYR